ncbi:septation protein IspZ [Cellvibrio sp. UBA7661]|uniref:septation protein IspZ n=1 Tax=Cellvibrio sp. UBA7661 TaxID=1946311 RepID=UPI002F35680F
MKSLLTLLLTIVSIAYPVLVYFGIQHLNPATFAIIIFVLGLVKFLSTNNKSDTSQILLLAAVSVYSAGLLLSNSEHWLKLYPVIISWSVAALFAVSLRHKETVIERMARLGGAVITPKAKHYIRVLTLVWVFLLIGNGLIALYLASFASMKSWVLYTGLLSYGFFALFFACEYAYRRHYIRKHNEQN